MRRTHPILVASVLFSLIAGCAGTGGGDDAEPPTDEVAEAVLSCCAAGDTCVGDCVHDCMLAGDTGNVCKNECQGECNCRVCDTGGGSPPPPICPAGQSLCMDGCSDLTSNTDCGSCGHTCSSGFGCSAQVCQTTIQQGNCVKHLGQCTGILGPTECVSVGATRSCATGGPLWGEAPWIITCMRLGPSGPVFTFQTGFDFC